MLRHETDMLLANCISMETIVKETALHKKIELPQGKLLYYQDYENNMQLIDFIFACLIYIN